MSQTAFPSTEQVAIAGLQMFSMNIHLQLDSILPSIASSLVSRVSVLDGVASTCCCLPSPFSSAIINSTRDVPVGVPHSAQEVFVCGLGKPQTSHRCILRGTLGGQKLTV